MAYQLTALIILAAFYTFYFAKIILQKKQSIKTQQMGIGNKPRKVLVIERITGMATVSACIAGVGSILLVKNSIMTGFRIAGIVIGVVAVLFFALATITMKNSWRVGIPEEKTTLITNGIYSWSRNPAFVGFDLLYFSVCLIFFNIPLVIVSVWAAVMLHLQILQEEEHMHRMFGKAYDEYKKGTLRYLGRKSMKTEKNILIAFILNLSFSIFEFIGGTMTNSVAIISDSIHDIGDAISIGISYFLEKKSKKQPDANYTYGYDGYNNYASMHIVTEADAHIIKENVREELREHGIGHVTLELESKDEVCHEEQCHVDYAASTGHHH